MSDPSHTPESESNDIEPTRAAPSKARNIRLTILLVILAVGSVAILYDYLVARAGVDAAYDKVNELSSGNAVRTDGRPLTRQDVQAVLDREPSETITEHGFEVDVYSWISGLPVRKHEYFVVYYPQGQALVTHFKNLSRSDLMNELDPNKFGDSSLPRSMDEWREHFGDEAADAYEKNFVQDDAQAAQGEPASDEGGSEPASED